MKAGSGQHFEQSYNAQAAVEVDSRLIVGERVSQAPNDKEELVPTVAAVGRAGGISRRRPDRQRILQRSGGARRWNKTPPASPLGRRSMRRWKRKSIIAPSAIWRRKTNRWRLPPEPAWAR